MIECVVSMQRFHKKDNIITASCTFKIKPVPNCPVRFSTHSGKLLCADAEELINQKYNHWFTPGIYIGGEYVVDENNYISSDSEIMYFSTRITLEEIDMDLICEYCDMIEKLSNVNTAFYVLSDGDNQSQLISVQKHLSYYAKLLHKDLTYLATMALKEN